MKCEANGCSAALEPKSLAGSAMGGASPWQVTDIPPGWCVRLTENTEVGTSRLVVLCPVHSAGVVQPAPPPNKPRPRYKVVADERTGVAHCPDLPSLGHFPGPIDDLDDPDGPWADPRLEVARLRSVVEAGVATSNRLAARNIELEGEVARLKAALEEAEAWTDRPPMVTRP